MYLKNKYRNRLRNVESNLRIHLSEMKQNIERCIFFRLWIKLNIS